MTGTREQEIQNHNSAAPAKVREGARPDSHPCGGCNACHQMTRIQTSSKIMGWSGEGAERAAPCATNFFQRNLGNSYMQSLADRNPVSGNKTPGRGAPAIQRKCNCGGSCESCAGKEDETGKIQTKLAIGSPDDEYEQEADRVADQVMRMSEPAEQVGDNDNRTNIRRVSESGGVSGSSGEGIDLDYNGGAPLAPSTRQFMEPRFGVNFSDVRLHNDADAHQAASQIQARAFTHGSHVWLGKGESEDSRNLMAHELTHVIQQMGYTARAIQKARLPCTSRTKVDVYAINLPGSTRSISDDLANANNILCQCGLEVNVTGGESWNTNLMDHEPPPGILNAPSGTVRALTAEETELLAYRPGGAVIHAYYVPGFTGPKVAESFWPAQHGEHAVVLGNNARPDSFPHELGHVLLNSGDHEADPKNLMASGDIRNVGVDELTQQQCSRMP